MTLEEVERTDDIIDPELNNFPEAVKNAQTEEEKVNLMLKVQRVRKESRAHMKDMLLKYVHIKQEELVKMNFLKVLLLWSAFYEGSTSISDFLKPQSKQESSSD